MRKIIAYPKTTSANTQYWEIGSEDTAFIFDWLLRAQCQVIERSQTKIALREYAFQGNQKFPRLRGGVFNSLASMTAGLLEQMRRGHDLTTAHLDAIEELFAEYDESYSGIDDFDMVRFDRKIFTLK